jgi:hypothetical protein
MKKIKKTIVNEKLHDIFWNNFTKFPNNMWYHIRRELIVNLGITNIKDLIKVGINERRRK